MPGLLAVGGGGVLVGGRSFAAIGEWVNDINQAPLPPCSNVRPQARGEVAVFSTVGVLSLGARLPKPTTPPAVLTSQF